MKPLPVKKNLNETKLSLPISQQLKEAASTTATATKENPGTPILFLGGGAALRDQALFELGKNAGKEVYKVNLSTVVSKFIGETEKNLELLFEKAASKNWILFFDEADALFGKRTDVKDAHDKYANQEIAFLIQRMEDYSGLAVLATNMRSNIDEAFKRRFRYIVDLELPKK